MRPFFVTAEEARKLPRLFLLGLCVLYVVPGFVGRDPWLLDDAASFGVVATLLGDPLKLWLTPNVFGQPFVEEGPLFFWLSALVAAGMPYLEPHFATRIICAVLLALCLAGVWYAAYELAKRPEAQPADPFRLSAHPVDFARAVADVSVLALISCLGLIERSHETTTEILQLSLIGLFIWGAAFAIESPRTGGTVAGLAIGMTVLSEGPALALALLIANWSLPLVSRQYWLVWGRMLTCTTVAALLVGLSWPLALYAGDSTQRTHLVLWLAQSFESFLNPSLIAQNIGWTLKTFPWYLWPLWPIAIWTLVRWRGAWHQPVIALPVLTVTICEVVMLLTGKASNYQMMALVPPLAVLAALGLPALAKGVTNLLDWLAVMIFSTFGLLVWAYYLALVTGFPPKMARSATRFTAGFDLSIQWVWLALAIAVTVLWVGIVRWRFQAVQKPIWRTIVLSGAGVAWVWFLLMSLWLPVFNHRKTYRDVSQEISQILPRTANCLNVAGLTVGERAVLGYYLRVRFAEQAQRASRDGSLVECDWLMVADRTNRAIAEPSASLWSLRWQGRRVAAKTERIRLYGRVGVGEAVAGGITEGIKK